MTRRSWRAWIPAVLALAFCACSPSQLAEAKSVARDVWSIARVLCLASHAEQAGVSVADVRDAVCSTQEQIAPWVQPALGAQRAGAVKAGIARDFERDAGAP